MTTQPSPLEIAQASDPSTPPATLQELAGLYPSLHPAIAANPATYPALLEWLGSLGNPAVDMAIAERDKAPTAPTPDAVPATALFAPTSPTPAVDPASAPSAPLSAGSAPLSAGSAPLSATSAPLADPLSAASAPTAAYNTGTTQLMAPLGAPTQASPLGPLTVTAGEEEGNRNRAILIGAIAAALVAVLVLIGWFVLAGRNKAEEAQAAHESQPEAVVTASARELPTPEATKSAMPEPSKTPDDRIEAPAPSNAVEMSSFTAPSGNIACELGTDTVTCTIREYEFIPESGTCSEGDPFTVTVGAQGEVEGNCNGSFPGGATLQYGSAAKNDAFACTSDQSGIQCWSQYTGDGIFLARQKAEIIQR